MFSNANVIAGAALAATFWTCIGFAVGQRLLPRALAWPLAPVLGWAAHSAVTLPVFIIMRFSATSVIAVGLLALAFAIYAIWTSRRTGIAFPAWAWALAALVAIAPALAILPKYAGDGVALAGPMFDHSKAAMIDEIVRHGVPPANPFFGAAGDRLAYYYLWYFAAAQLAACLGISGWEADAAMTWFTGFASLSLMMGFAVWLGARASATFWVAVFALAGSLRYPLWLLLGTDRVNNLLWPATGLGGWLFQATWVPQHVMSAACVVLAVLLLVRLASAPKPLTTIALALVAVAGFASSTFVGGITFAAVAPAVVLFLLVGMERKLRARFLLACFVAAALAVVLASPFLIDQAAATALRGVSLPIGIAPYEVVGPVFLEPLRRLLDLPAFWLILLLIEFPAIYLAGGFTLARFATHGPETTRKKVAGALGVLALVSLAVAWLLTSRLGEHNDLAWRAVLPAVLALSVAAAAGIARWIARQAYSAAIAAIVAVLIALPDGIKVAAANAIGHRAPSAAAFARSPELWAAVRKHASAGERVANNPLFLADITPWPVNISWALLADRRSCFAGRELALAYVPLPDARREAINTQFVRVFAGEASAAEANELATRFGCQVVVLVSSDGAWSKDPFAASFSFRLVEHVPDRWRIYRAN
jgi:hypothetical protein